MYIQGKHTIFSHTFVIDKSLLHLHYVITITVFSRLSLTSKRIFTVVVGFLFLNLLLCPSAEAGKPPTPQLCFCTCCTKMGSGLHQAAVVSAQGGRSQAAQQCTVLQITPSQAGELHKPEPFPGRYLAVAKISPLLWIN